MKHRKAKILLEIATSGTLLFTLVTGCTKDNAKPNTNTFILSKGVVSATVAGAAFQSQYMFGSYTTATSTVKMDGLQLNPGDTTELSVYFPNTIQLNQPTALGPGYLIYYSDWTSGLTYGGGLFSRQLGHGLITLTAWDSASHTIEGTFSGVLQDPNGNDSVVVANGQFSGSYNVVP